MPLICPHCHAERVDEDSPCPYCGQPASAGTVLDQQRERDRRFPFWTILPWTLLAAALLFLLPRVMLHPAPAMEPVGGVPAASLATPPAPTAAPLSVSDPPAPSVSDPPAPSVSPLLPPAKMPMNSSVPLSVTLYSAGGDRHIPVGVPIMISAYAGLPPGQITTLTISYAKNDGSKSLLSLTQGRLSITSWTPSAPGHYWFIASALDTHKNSAFSRRLSLWVDRSASVSPRPRRTVPARFAQAKPVPQTKTISVPSVVKKPATPLPYHVAAAKFSVQSIASTLADALRHRGFNAIVRPSNKGAGTQSYTVETGDYVSHTAAQKQMQALQHDGYPAYLYRVR